MDHEFETVLASLDDQYRMTADIDRLTNALAESLDYPTQAIQAIVDNQAAMLEALV